MDYYINHKELTSSFGAGNSIFLSIRPGLNRALSKISIRLVAMMTLMFCVGSKPSNWFNNSNIVRCTSLSPVVLKDNYLERQALKSFSGEFIIFLVFEKPDSRGF